MVIIRGDPNLDKHEYFNYGLQYYIAARSAYLSQLFPVCGNLFHLSIEMFLLAGLVKVNSAEQLKIKYHKHFLPGMWADFKKNFPEVKMQKFNKLISKCHKWEDLRYPVKGSDSDIVMTFGLSNSDKASTRLNGRKSIEFTLSLDEVDKFFKFVVGLLSINPDYVKSFLSFGFGERLATYEKYNKYIVWAEEDEK